MSEYEGPTVADLSNLEEERRQLRERRLRATADLPPTRKETRMATVYKILEQTTDGQWEMRTEVTASGPKTAIRAALDGGDGTEGTFVAIPARSWRPVTARVETKRQLKIG